MVEIWVRRRGVEEGSRVQGGRGYGDVGRSVAVLDLLLSRDVALDVVRLSGHVEEGLDGGGREEGVLLPQIQHSHYARNFGGGTGEEMSKGGRYILAEPSNKGISFKTKLMTRLPHDGIHHIQTWQLVLRLTLMDEPLNKLDHMFVLFGALKGGPRYRTHLCLRDRRSYIV